MEQSNEFIPAMKCSFVIAECEKQFGLPRGTLKEKSKLKRVVQIRHIAVLLCRKITGRSYPQIAIAVGYKDHTTCLYACKVAPQLLVENPELAAMAKAVEDALNA
jgi:chromosomal replication initiator protein